MYVQANCFLKAAYATVKAMIPCWFQSLCIVTICIVTGKGGMGELGGVVNSRRSLCLLLEFGNKLLLLSMFCLKHMKEHTYRVYIARWFEFCSRQYRVAFTTFLVYSGKPCPPFKIVILDEADSMTNAAQVSTHLCE